MVIAVSIGGLISIFILLVIYACIVVGSKADKDTERFARGLMSDAEFDKGCGYKSAVVNIERAMSNIDDKRLICKLGKIKQQVSREAKEVSN